MKAAITAGSWDSITIAYQGIAYIVLENCGEHPLEVS
jgi:hypothetical protein